MASPKIGQKCNRKMLRSHVGKNTSQTYAPLPGAVEKPFQIWSYSLTHVNFMFQIYLRIFYWTLSNFVVSTRYMIINTSEYTISIANLKDKKKQSYYFLDRTLIHNQFTLCFKSTFAYSTERFQIMQSHQKRRLLIHLNTHQHTLSGLLH